MKSVILNITLFLILLLSIAVLTNSCENPFNADFVDESVKVRSLELLK